MARLASRSGILAGLITGTILVGTTTFGLGPASEAQDGTLIPSNSLTCRATATHACSPSIRPSAQLVAPQYPAKCGSLFKSQPGIHVKAIGRTPGPGLNCIGETGLCFEGM